MYPITATMDCNYPIQSNQPNCIAQDTVFWLNLPTGIYHYKGQHWYGNTKSGAYVCQKEADKAGDRATKGQ